MSAPRHRPRGLLPFYLPLVATSQMMTLSNPLLNLHLSRAEDPSLPLAAYSVAFGLSVVLNAPLLTLPNVGAGLLENERAWDRMRTVALLLASVVFVADCILGLTPLGHWAFRTLLGTTARVAAQAQATMICVAPIPLFLAWRGLRTALVLRARKTQILTQSTFVRLLFLGLALLAARLRAEPVAADAGLALSLGICAETLWLHRQTRSHRSRIPTTGPLLDTRHFGAFAIPLVVSGWAWTAQRPIISAILGRSPDGEAAQAAFGVLHPLLLLVASALWALQATGQIHGRERAEARRFVAFAARAILLAAGVIGALGWIPPARNFLIGDVFPVAEDLGEYLVPGLRLLFLPALFLGIRTTAKGLILASRSTRVILPASAGYLALLGILGVWVVRSQPAVNGGVLAVALIAVVEMTEAAVLCTAAWRRWLRLPAQAES
jgi:hypothetical protein